MQVGTGGGGGRQGLDSGNRKDRLKTIQNRGQGAAINSLRFKI